MGVLRGNRDVVGDGTWPFPAPLQRCAIDQEDFKIFSLL